MKPIKRTRKEMDQLIEFNSNNTYKCSCGHSVVIYPTETKRLCTWCNHYAYREKSDKFVNDLTNLLRKEKNKND